MAAVMFGLALSSAAEANRFHQSATEMQKPPPPPQQQQQQQQYSKESSKHISAGRKRRLRRKKNKNREKSLIPPLPTPPKFSSRSDRHVARDLYLALRCSWSDGPKRTLNRVLLANWEGDVVADHTVNQENFPLVRAKIVNKIEGKVLIGHGLKDSLYALKIQHPWKNLRDAASYLPFMKETVDPLTVMVLPRQLPDLIRDILETELPEEDGSPGRLHAEAKACMDLYRSVRFDWENETTKLLQQKERQRDVVLEHRDGPLTSISEDASVAHTGEEGEVLLTANHLAGLDSAPPVTAHKKIVSLNDRDPSEDQSTQAPTEATPDESSVRDDLSVRTKTSDQSIWRPSDTASEDGSRIASTASSSWGLWLLPKPEQGGTYPTDSDDWLNDETASNASTDYSAQQYGYGGGPVQLQQSEEESFGHLPSRLLNDSSSDNSEHEVPVREESTNHFVEGMDYEDWLEPDPGLRRSWLGRRKSLQEDPKRCASPLQSQVSSSTQENINTTEHSQGERGQNNSSHHSAKGDDWPSEDESKASRFSFFRKKSAPMPDETESTAEGEEPVAALPGAAVSPGRFSLFRQRKSVEDCSTKIETLNL